MSESTANHTFALYLGCIAPNRYPGVESASIKGCKKLGIDLVPLKGASCCPAPGAFGSIDLNVFYAMAARNLVLAEQMKTDIALVCNGCYKSIWEVNHKLKHNQDLRDNVNEVLKEVDMEYKGTINVYHVAELLYNDKFAGVSKIKDSVVNPLTGARIAVHYGCHLTKPHKDREFEKEVMLNTEHPTWMEELVAALGATPSNTATRCSAVVPAAVSAGTISSTRWISPTRRCLTSKRKKWTH